MFIIKKLAACLGLAPLLYLSLNFADWEPKAIWENADISFLENTNFLHLKENITIALKGSWCSNEKINLLMDLILIEKPKICVEIGAFTGSSILPVAAVLAYHAQGKVYAIDGWSNAVTVKNLDEKDPNKNWWRSVDMNAVHDSFVALMKFWQVTKFVQEVALSSEVASLEIPDEIDFIHLDGDYSEVGSL